MSDLRVLLLTSSDTSEDAMAKLRALSASIDRQGVEGDHVLVLRGEGMPELPESASVRVHAVKVPFETSLARARNAAIEYARDKGLVDRADMVGFPDDDCEYEDGALARVAWFLSAGDAYVCVPYAPSPDAVNRRRFPARDVPLSPELAMQVASCAGTFFRGWTIAAIGDFDERYGLGAPYGASEDTDYVLRAIAAGLPGTYHGCDALVRHPYKSYRPAQYYLGNVAALAKHARGGGTGYLLARRLGQGALLGVARRIPANDYVRALRATRELVGTPAAAELPAATDRSEPSPRTSARGL